MDKKRIAIVGAGPVGLEAALYALHLGHRVTVYERGRVGQHIREWGHVRLFSSFAINHSPLAARVLNDEGARLPHSDEYQTGRGYVEGFIEPLARSSALRKTIREQTGVLAIGRDRLLKGDLIGGPRQTHPFRLLVVNDGVESTETADVVLDCTGTWGQANSLGNGGIPAPGERAAADRIRYRLDDILGADRQRYEGKRVMLIGAGHSAITALDRMLELPEISTLWIRRGDATQPYTLHEDDPLPERDRLNRLGNRLASGDGSRVDARCSRVVERIDTSDSGRLSVTLAGPHGNETEQVDTILALVGYQPDRGIYAELQIHECWATMGPIKLAATLLASANADCLAQTSAGADALSSPEPGFFILGAKSYGKNVNFLIRLGLEQIRDVFTLIEDDPALDLYARDGLV
jgi:thioredoxin reductase